MPGSDHDEILAIACYLHPRVRRGQRLIHVAGLALKTITRSIQEVNVRILECLKLLTKQQQEWW